MSGRKRAGFTLVEVLLALGLFSVLMLILVRLSDTALTILDGTERGRELAELGSDLMEQMARDLRGLEPGASGDLLCAWEARDQDGDGLAGLVLPRLALVRSRSAAEASRAVAREAAEPEGAGELLREARAGELVEVLWSFAPAAADPLAPPALLRAERALGDTSTPSLLPLAASAGDARQVAALSDEAARGVLWLSFWFASTTSRLDEGWRLGERLGDCSASWDAWVLGRADRERSGFNEPAPGVAGPTDLPLLPRRVRIELELERPRDLAQRPRLAAALEPGETVLRVDGVRAWPPEKSFVRIDEEWVELVATRGEEATVVRARRGTVERAHKAGALLHHGQRFVREVPLALARQEWMR